MNAVLGGAGHGSSTLSLSVCDHPPDKSDPGPVPPSPRGVTPASKVATIPGCTRRAAVTASRRKRSRRCGSAAKWASSTLTATGRLRTSSRPSQTSAIPPFASGRTKRYRPARARGTPGATPATSRKASAPRGVLAGRPLRRLADPRHPDGARTGMGPDDGANIAYQPLMA